jgi:hypothetical protein
MDEGRDAAKNPTSSNPVNAAAKPDPAPLVEVPSPPLMSIDPAREMTPPTGQAPGADPVIETVIETKVSTPQPADAASVLPVMSRSNAMALAATALIAVVLGAAIGAFAMSFTPRESAAVSAEDAAQLKRKIAKLESDVSAVRTSLDAAGKTATGQFAKLAERLDRTERAQAEPAAKLAKIADAVERLEKRPASDITGSIAAPAAKSRPAIVTGWHLRDVYNGVALVDSRYGTIEVETGDTLPGLGQVEAIRKQDGRWAVVTPKGLIVSP